MSSTIDTENSIDTAFSMASNEPGFTFQVTAGPSYDEATQKEVVVNGEEPLHIETEDASISLSVRIRDYAGKFQSATPSIYRET
jgi:hypothetical protein